MAKILNTACVALAALAFTGAASAQTASKPATATKVVKAPVAAKAPAASVKTVAAAPRVATASTRTAVPRNGPAPTVPIRNAPSRS